MIIFQAIDMRKYCKCSELPRKDPRDAIITIKKLLVEDKEEQSEKEQAQVVPKDTKQGA